MRCPAHQCAQRALQINKTLSKSPTPYRAAGMCRQRIILPHEGLDISMPLLYNNRRLIKSQAVKEAVTAEYGCQRGCLGWKHPPDMRANDSSGASRKGAFSRDTGGTSGAFFALKQGGTTKQTFRPYSWDEGLFYCPTRRGGNPTCCPTREIITAVC